MNPDTTSPHDDYLAGHQANLWDPRPRWVGSTPPPDPPDLKRLSFLEFHRLNPAIYEELRRLALRLVAAGRKRYGIKSLFEVLRWHRAIDTTSEVLKLNNNHTAYYARELMDTVPELAGFFSLRASPGTISELAPDDPDFE